MGLRTLAHSLCLVALVLAVAACGGGDGDAGAALGEGAEFAPATVAAFVELDTDVDGGQWRKAESLLDRFPGREALLDDIRREWKREGLTWERDVRPALAGAVYLVWLDFTNDGENVVGFTKPADNAKFERVLESGDGETVHREIEGWLVFAETRTLLDRFQEARAGDSLGDEDRFRDAMGEVPQDAIARAFLNGDKLQREVDESLSEQGLAADLTRKYGRLETLAAAVAARDDGVFLAADVASELASDAEPYTPELPPAVPAGAIAYFSFGDLEEGLGRVLNVLAENDRDFARQRAQAERGLGFTLEDDVLPLFGGEGGVAVYRATPEPEIALVLAVDDEGEARRLIDGLGALAQFGRMATMRRLRIQGVDVRQVRFPELSLFAAVSRGRLVVTTGRGVLRDTLDGGRTLAGDDAFRRAGQVARLPDETTGFAFLDLDRAVPFVVDYAKREGERVPVKARRNAEPLRTLLLWGAGRGDAQTLTGFLEIEE